MKDLQKTEIAPELVLRAQAGDREAFGELYERSAAQLYRSIFSMVREESAAWDIHQNSYLLAWQHLKKLEKPEAFLPWLRRIAVNETVKELQKDRPLNFTELTEEAGEEPQIPETRPDRQPELELDRQEAARLVREILEDLPQKQRLIVGMYYYEGMRVKEIAETLGVTQGTVKTQLHLGRKKVETQVRRLEGEGVKLYGLAPMAFLTALLGRQAPAKVLGKQAAEALLAKAAPLGGETVALTAKAVGSGFFHSVWGKVTAGLLAVAVTAGGVAGYRALKPRLEPNMGDYRPPATVATEAREITEGPTELETALPTEPPAAERRMENPFSGPLASASDYVLAAVYNEPFDQGIPAPTVNWNAGAEDRLVIYPRYPGSTVSARRIVYDAEGRASIEETPVYSTLCGPEDCIAASLERPAEGPAWVLTVRTPDGMNADWVLLRNSRYGPLSFENLCDLVPYAGEDAALFENSELYGSIADRLLGGVGYDGQRQGSVYQMLPYDADSPFVRLGLSQLHGIFQALEPFGINAGAFVWNEWFAEEAAAWTVAESRMEGDSCVLEAGVVHEYYMNELYKENFVEGQGSPEQSVAEEIAGQARLFARDRLLGYGGQEAAQGESLRFDLHGLLVYNPTLAAKSVSLSVNGREAGSFALTEGDFFTWIPLDFPNQPGDAPLRVEARITETYFGAPDRALLNLWPQLGSNLRGGR